MFHFGMPTLLEFETLEENVVFCSQHDLQFVEINMNMPEFQVEVLKKDYLNWLTEKYGVYFTFHMADDIDVANFQQEIRRVNVDLVKRTLEFAESVNSPIVNMHMQRGVVFTLPKEKVYIYQKYLNRYMSYVMKFSDEVNLMLNRMKVNLAVENTGDFDKEYIRQSTGELLKHKNIVMTYDIGHDYSFGNDRPFIIDNLESIRHMHIHDAIGKDHHLALGSGDMQLERYIGFAKNYDIRCVIEAKTIKALTESVKALPDYL